MKRGEPPPRGLKELVVRLGGGPRPTNQVIRQSVKEKFGVTVDDKTIRRYCKAAGLPTSSRLSRQQEGKPTAPEKDDLWAPQLEQSGHWPSLQRGSIPEINKLAKRLQLLTNVPKPSRPFIPETQEAETEIIHAGMKGNTAPFLEAMLSLSTPWWCASGMVQVTRHLTWEDCALFDHFVGLPTSQRLKASLTDWEHKTNEYLKRKQLNAAINEIEVAYQEAKQAEYALHSDLWHAVEAIR